MNKNILKDNKIYTIAEIGINHNGDINLAKKMIKQAKDLGFNSVKFQKRFPEECVPLNKRNQLRTTPWGEMTYFEYKQKIEFWEDEYFQIDDYSRSLGIDWSASAWDLSSIDFLKKFDLPYIKVPSDKSTDKKYLKAIKDTGFQVILSTGGTSLEQIKEAVNILDEKDLILLQCTSQYPCPTKEVHLRVIDTLKKNFDLSVGFSSHHTSPMISIMAAVYGAKVIETHFTLDRAMWGTDQAMSLEPRGMEILNNSIREFEIALGSSEKIISSKESVTLSRTVGRELNNE